MSSKKSKPDPLLSEDWIKELRETLKNDNRKVLLSTILGSSVLAALIGAGASIGLERLRFSSSANLEDYKAAVQIRTSQLIEARAAYSTLGDKLTQIGLDLDFLVRLWRYEIKGAANQSFSKDADAYFDQLTDHMNELYTLINNDTKTDPNVRQRIRDAINNLSVRLNEVQKNTRMISGFVAIYEEKTKKEIVDIKMDIEEKKKSLV